MLDEMKTWAGHLHARYDYPAPTTDSGASPQAAPVVAGVLTVSPLTASLWKDGRQIIHLSSGASGAGFTAGVGSDTGWLAIGLAGSSTAPGVTPLTGNVPDGGTRDLAITVISASVTANSHSGTVTIAGTGSASRTTIVNIEYKEKPGKPSEDDLTNLNAADNNVAQAASIISLISDNTKALEAAQGALRTAYVALVKVEDDFKRRKDTLRVVYDPGDGLLYQNFDVGTDRKVTSPGYISCVSDLDGKTPTTTNINTSLLYQSVPRWSASAGLLTSFLPKTIIGLTDTNNSTVATAPGDVQSFQVTDRARAQVVPMAFINYRLGHHQSTFYGKGKENELVWTEGVSAGIGINPNTGTNQPEFFLGLALGMNRLIIHPGIHFGRTESLGGGYSLNVPFVSTTSATGTVVPPTVPSTVPLSWSYHVAFSIGFSVRVAPY